MKTDKECMEVKEIIKGVGNALEINPVNYSSFSAFLAAVKKEVVKQGIMNKEEIEVMEKKSLRSEINV